MATRFVSLVLTRLRAALALTALTSIVAFAGASAASASDGYRLLERHALMPAAQYQLWQRSGSHAAIWATVMPTHLRTHLEVVQARGRIHGGLETVSSMCRRTPGCLAGWNGDFFVGARPFGGVVSGGRLLRSPVWDHEQLALHASRVTVLGWGQHGWGGSVADHAGHTYPLNGVNRSGAGKQLVMFTPAYGNATPACTCNELVLVGDPANAGTSGTTQYRVGAFSHGRTRLLPNRVVLTGYGAMADSLARWWQTTARTDNRVAVTLHMGQPLRQSVGGHPIMMENGKPWPYDPGQRFRDPWLRRPAPRTVAFTGGGLTGLVTFDGREGPAGSGVTAQQALAFVREHFRATTVFGLDGGGSTTFVVGARVLNHPSDGRERPVANAILLVDRSTAPAPRPSTPPTAPAAPAAPASEPSTAATTGHPSQPPPRAPATTRPTTARVLPDLRALQPHRARLPQSVALRPVANPTRPHRWTPDLLAAVAVAATAGSWLRRSRRRVRG